MVTSATPTKLPLRVTHQIGGNLEHETCRESVGFPVVLCGEPPVPARFFVSSASTCSVVRYSVFKESGLETMLPHSLTFRPLREGIDQVRLVSICQPGKELKALAVADCPFEYGNRLMTPSVFLVEDSEILSLVDGILGMDFLREHAVGVGYTIDGQQLTFE